MGKPRLLVIYHFFHPDQVVSARIFSDLAEEQARRGWDVTALTCNRSHAEPRVKRPAYEEWNGVKIHRAFRPAWSQKHPLPRLANTAWMLNAWILRSMALGPFDAIVIGSDPSFAAALAIPLRACDRGRRSFTGASTSTPTRSWRSGAARRAPWRARRAR